MTENNSSGGFWNARVSDLAPSEIWRNKRLICQNQVPMGHYTRVTQAVSRMKRQPGRKLEKMKRRLLNLEEKPA
jgi:hypothetical protein